MWVLYNMRSIHFMEQNLTFYRTIYTVAMHIQMEKNICIRETYKNVYLKKGIIAANKENKILNQQ